MASVRMTKEAKDCIQLIDRLSQLVVEYSGNSATIASRFESTLDAFRQLYKQQPELFSDEDIARIQELKEEFAAKQKAHRSSSLRRDQARKRAERKKRRRKEKEKTYVVFSGGLPGSGR